MDASIHHCWWPNRTCGYLLLMIIKQYLLITKALMTERASLIAQLVKNLPAMPETLVRFLGKEDPLEKR